MFKKHTYSPNHKVVAGPHNYSPPAPGGGPAGAPGGGMDASGGASANYSDGGIIDSLKDAWNQAWNSKKDQPAGTSGNEPLASSKDADTSPGAGKGGAQKTKATLDAADAQS